MPFKSQKQRAWGADQVKQGKWTQAQFDEWNSETPKNIPDRVSHGPGKVKSVKMVKKIKTIK